MHKYVNLLNYEKEKNYPENFCIYVKIVAHIIQSSIFHLSSLQRLTFIVYQIVNVWRGGPGEEKSFEM